MAGACQEYSFSFLPVVRRVTCLVQLSSEHPEQKITVKNNADLNKIWLKGDKLSPKSPFAKHKITDPDYMETAWEKTEKRD